MPRPRRPVLAACCAVLLLSTATLCARGLWRFDLFGWGMAGHGVSVGLGAGNVKVWSVPTRGAVKAEWFPSRPIDGLRARDVLWFRVERGPNYTHVSAPLWPAILVSGLGTWWSWRGRKAGAGFPVDPAAGEAK